VDRFTLIDAANLVQLLAKATTFNTKVQVAFEFVNAVIRKSKHQQREEIKARLSKLMSSGGVFMPSDEIVILSVIDALPL
jgi:hypothetical protein